MVDSLKTKLRKPGWGGLIQSFARYFVPIVAAVAILSTFVFYAHNPKLPPLRSDGLGYYAYLPSIFIHADLTMESYMLERLDGEQKDGYAGLRKVDTANAPIVDLVNQHNEQDVAGEVYLNQFAVGISILQLPFFLIGMLITLIVSGGIGTGFQLAYQGSVGFAGIFYGLVGLFFLQKLLSNYFSKQVTVASLFVLTFGTNLFHYMTYDSVFSHAYSFGVISVFIYLVDEWWRQNKRSFARAALIAVIAGLIVMIRPANLFFLLAFPMWGLWEAVSLKERLNELWQQRAQLLTIIGVGMVAIVPQLTYWYLITGNLVVSGYGLDGQDFNFFNPQIGNVLFSAQKGLFWWAPALVLVIPGLWLWWKYLANSKLAAGLVKRAKDLPIGLIATLSVTVINTYLIASWWHWPFGGSYGHRAFIDLFPLWSVPVAFSVRWVWLNRYRMLGKVLIILVALAVLLNLFKMTQYWIGVIPPNGVSVDCYISSFWAVDSSYSTCD